MAVELGVGYLSILPSMRDFKKKLDSAVGHLTTSITVVPDTAKATAAFRSLKVPSLEASVNPRVEGFTARLRSAIGDQSSVGRQMGDTAGSGLHDALTSAARRTVATIAGIFAAQKLIDVGQSAFKEAANFETTQVAFTGLLGSAQLANDELAKLQRFAAVTPFEFPELADASKKLLAFGFSAGDIIPTMQTLGDAAAALGATGPDINLVVRAIGQILSKGKIQAEEVNQIAENFPGANVIPALAAEVGASTGALQEAFAKPGGVLKEFGLTGARAVEVILESFQNLNGAAGAMERQSRTLNGAMSNLKDTLRIAAIESLKPFLPGIANFINGDIVPAVTKFGGVFSKTLLQIGNSSALGLASHHIFGFLRGIRAAFTDTFNPADGFGSDVGEAIGRFAKSVGKALNLASHHIFGFFRGIHAAFTGTVDVARGFGAEFGEAVGRAARGFRDAFKGDIAGSVSKGWTGVLELVGADLRRFVDFVKANLPVAVQAFKDGFNGKDISGGILLQVIGGIGDGVARLVQFLTVDLPNALIDARAAFDVFKDAFNGVDTGQSDEGLLGFVKKIGDALGRLNDLIKENPDLKDLVSNLTLLAGALVVLNKVPGGTKVLGGLASSLLSLAPFLLTNPFGLLLVGLGLLGGALVAADAQAGTLGDSVDSVQKAFKEGGFGAAAAEAVKQIGNAFDTLWDLVRPKLQLFIDQTKTWFKKHIADLLNFEVASPGSASDFPGTGFAPPGSQGANGADDFPGTGFAPVVPPKMFDSFSAGFEDWFKNTFLPLVSKKLDELADFIAAWIETNGPKITKALGKFIEDNAPAIVKSVGKAFVLGQAEVLGAISVVAGDAITRLTAAALDALGRFTVGALEAVGRFTVEALAAIGRFTVEALAEVGKFVVDAVVEVGKGLGTFAVVQAAFLGEVAFTILEWIGRVVAGVLEAIGKLAVDAVVGLFNLNLAILSWIAGTIIDIVTKAQELGAAILGWIGDAVTAAPGKLAEFGGAILGFIGGLGSQIASAADGMWDGIYEAFKGAINFIIRAWNGLNFTVPTINTPFGKLGGFTLGGFHIDELAAGGFVTRPTLALVGEAGPEIVAPQRMLAETFRRELSAVGAGGQGVSFGGVTINEANDPSKTLAVLDGWARWKLTGRGER